MASCFFEVIILVFVPACPVGGSVLPGADAVLSEVRMLRCTTAGTQTNGNRTMALMKPASYFTGNNARFVALLHPHERHGMFL